MNNYKICPYCGDLLEMHHITHHKKLCYLHPDNIKVIASFIKSNLSDITKLNRNAFLKLGKKHNILSSMSIMNRLNVKDWSVALYQLAIYCYLNGLMTFEQTEILLYQLSHGTFWSDYEYFKSQNKLSFNEEINSHIIDIRTIYSNYQNLLGAVLIRSLIDCTHNQGEIQTDKNDVLDAASFLLEFPTMIMNNWHLLSDDVKDYYFSLNAIKDLDFQQFLKSNNSAA